jgi:hypothetical protein
MLIRTGLWSLESAKSWLANYEWGAAIASTLEENPDTRRQTAWVCMVMDLEAIVSGTDAAQSAIHGHRGDGDDALAYPALPCEPHMATPMGG